MPVEPLCTVSKCVTSATGSRKVAEQRGHLSNPLSPEVLDDDEAGGGKRDDSEAEDDADSAVSADGLSLCV